VAEVHGVEILGRQQSQGQDLVAFDGFPLGVVIDETQVFQALAPFGEGGGIQDQAVLPGGPGPVQPPAQVEEEAPVKRPPTPFGLLEAVEGVFLGLKQRLERSVEQVMDGLEMQKHHIGQDKHEEPRAEAFTFADAGAGQMALDMEHGKQIFEPQFQIGVEIFQRRFDLSLKETDFPVMQEKAPLLWLW